MSQDQTENLTAIGRAILYATSYDFSPTVDDDKLSMNPVGVWAVDAEARVDDGEWVFPEQEIRKIIQKALATVPEVVSVCAQVNEEETMIWTLLESYDRDARERVYKQELAICAALHLYDFDFRVTSIDLVSPHDLIKSGCQEIYRRQ